MSQVHLAQQDLFAIMRTLREHAPEGVAEKRPSPEFEAFARRGIAANVTSFKANAIHHADINAVRDRMRPLDGAPGIVLSRAELSLLRWMPSDRCGIKQNARSLQSREPRAFRIPLVPADERAELSGGGIKGLEAKIAGSEIKLFVVERIVGNVHLAVDAAQCAIGIENRGRVVIEAGSALLKERSDQHDFILQSRSGELLRARAWDWLREIEQSGVFALAEILCLKELGQADNVRALACRFRNAVKRFGQIVGRLGAARHLDQGDGEFFSHFFSTRGRRGKPRLYGC